MSPNILKVYFLVTYKLFVNIGLWNYFIFFILLTIIMLLFVKPISIWYNIVFRVLHFGAVWLTPFVFKANLLFQQSIPQAINSCCGFQHMLFTHKLHTTYRSCNFPFLRMNQTLYIYLISTEGWYQANNWQI